MPDVLLIFGGLAIVAVAAIVVNIAATRNAPHRSDQGLGKLGDGSQDQGGGGGSDSL